MRCLAGVGILKGSFIDWEETPPYRTEFELIVSVARNSRKTNCSCRIAKRRWAAGRTNESELASERASVTFQAEFAGTDLRS